MTRGSTRLAARVASLTALATLVALTTGAALVGAAGPAPAAENGPRIIGGNEVSPTTYSATWPWVVLVRIRTSALASGPLATFSQCTGSVIAPQLVQTAAHCTERASSPNRVTVLAGSPATASMTSVGTVDAVLTDPAYVATEDDINAVGDVGLIHLASPIPASLVPRYAVLARLAPAGMVAATTLGWGKTSGSASAASATLNSVGVSVRLTSAGTLHNSGPRGTCNGDSGGPLVAGGLLIGSTSYGDEECASDSFYTDTASVAPWIMTTAAGLSGTPPTVASPPVLTGTTRVSVLASARTLTLTLPTPTATGGVAVTCSRPATRRISVPSRTVTTCRARTGGGVGTTSYVVAAARSARAVAVRTLAGRLVGSVRAATPVALRATGFAARSRVSVVWGPLRTTAVADAHGVVRLHVRTPRVHGTRLLTLRSGASVIQVRAQSVRITR